MLDRETGTYADHRKVHTIDFEGKYFKCRGPLNTVRSPQGKPAFIQAGGSPRGREFAAKSADSIIATASGIEGMKAYRDDVRARAEKHGRKPDDIKVLFLVSPVLGETEEEARAKQARQRSSETYMVERLAGISSVTDVDFSQFDLDEPLPEFTTNGERGSLDKFAQWGSGKTLRQLVQDSGGVSDSVELVGTPDQVAERMGEVMAEVGGDGFLISSPGMRNSRRYITEIADGLVPALQRRGLARTEYTSTSATPSPSSEVTAGAGSAPLPEIVVSGAITPGSAGLMSVAGLTPMLVSSWLWHLTRWGGLFCCTYLVTKLTHAPFLTQLVGAVIFAPMLLGGFAAGAISDRFDRRRVVLATEAALMPVMFAMFAVVGSGEVRVWMVFPFMFALGVGGLVNMTCQRALVVDVTGAGLAARALTMESVGLASASMAGPLLCGATIGALGLGAAFGLLAVALCLSAVILVFIPRHGAAPQPRLQVSLGDQARQSFALLRRSPPLVSMLGVTVVFNVFYFSFTPLRAGDGRAFPGRRDADGCAGRHGRRRLPPRRPRPRVAGGATARARVRRRCRVRPRRSGPVRTGARRRARTAHPARRRRGKRGVLIHAELAGDRGGGRVRARSGSGPGQHGHRIAPPGHGAPGGERRGARPRVALMVSSLAGLAVLTAWLRSHPHVLES